MLLLVHFHVKPHINSIHYCRDLHKLNTGMDYFILALYSISDRSGKNMREEKKQKHAQLKDRLSKSSEIFFFFFFTLCFPPNPMLRCLKEVLLIRQTTLIFPLKLYLPVCLSLCDCWNIISYFFMSVRALGQGLGA